MFLTKGTLRRFFRRLFFFVISAAMCFTAFAPLPRTAPAVRNRDTGDFFLPDYGSPLVAAHRMGKSNAPENTLMAVKNSISIRNGRSRREDAEGAGIKGSLRLLCLRVLFSASSPECS